MGKVSIHFIQEDPVKLLRFIDPSSGQSYLRHKIYFHLRSAEYYNIIKYLLHFWSGENQLRYCTNKFKKLAPGILKIHQVGNKTT